jgi:hypothetical protein
MKLNTKILSVKTVHELNFYWANEDYIGLLDAFDYPNPEQIDPNELLDYLNMAISDFEPDEAAEVVLTYKLKDKLSKGQIENLSHEMLEDKVAEEYPDPAFHFDLFNINQLLFKAYNGTFPDTRATIITMIYPDQKVNLTKEVLIKTICAGLKANNLISRLYEEQIDGTEPFGDAEKVIWNFRKMDNEEIEIITSNYWIEKDDFDEVEFEADVKLYKKG